MGLRQRLILVLVIPPMLVGVCGLIRVRAGHAELLGETERTVILVARAIRASVQRGLRELRGSDLEGRLAEIVKDQDQIDQLIVSNRLLLANAVPADVLRRVTETGEPEEVSSGMGYIEP
jgi:hypothetical protein